MVLMVDSAASSHTAIMISIKLQKYVLQIVLNV